MSEKRKRNQRGKVTFNVNWLSDERFKLWFQKSKGKHKAICKLCNYAVIDIVVMGGQCPCIPCKRGKAPG